VRKQTKKVQPQTVQEIWDRAAKRGIEESPRMTPEERTAQADRNYEQMLISRGWENRPEPRPTF
jgi:hypothetical protein